LCACIRTCTPNDRELQQPLGYYPRRWGMEGMLLPLPGIVFGDMIILISVNPLKVSLKTMWRIFISIYDRTPFLVFFLAFLGIKGG
jgi:hypothetical protein